MYTYVTTRMTGDKKKDEKESVDILVDELKFNALAQADLAG